MAHHKRFTKAQIKKFESLSKVAMLTILNMTDKEGNLYFELHPFHHLKGGGFITRAGLAISHKNGLSLNTRNLWQYI